MQIIDSTSYKVHTVPVARDAIVDSILEILEGLFVIEANRAGLRADLTDTVGNAMKFKSDPIFQCSIYKLKFFQHGTKAPPAKSLVNGPPELATTKSLPAIALCYKPVLL
jgi:hypothetical protein